MAFLSHCLNLTQRIWLNGIFQKVIHRKKLIAVVIISIVVIGNRRLKMKLDIDDEIVSKIIVGELKKDYIAQQ
jgi:hypothetical protein